MEKNSPEQYSFQIQEIRKTPEKVDSSIKEDWNIDVTENMRYVLHHSFTNANSMSSNRIQEQNKAKVILLGQEAVRDCQEIYHVNRQVIDLNDNDSKMALKQQFGKRQNLNVQSTAAGYENMDILQKLPLDTVVIKQKARTNTEDSDCREFVETNSSESSFTSGYAATKVQKISRVIRNKSRETVKVRRNPMRISKKNIDKDFPWHKKRLLSNNKREIYLNYEPGKRMKSSTMPYMNTRSVTRKMYTVGATYQAPTKRDETEWKEWPVHGMHERPVYHPQAGLVVEYLGKYFTSLDGSSYCEIINEPEMVEVVAVDPHRHQRISSMEKISRERTKMKNKRPSNVKDAWNSYFSVKNKSFETCMHGSLHCVLGYCSQVMLPAYKQTVEEKMTKMAVSATSINSPESAKKMASIKDNAASSSENTGKFPEEAKLLEAYAIAMAQSVQNKSTMKSCTNDQNVAPTLVSSLAMHIPEAQRLTVEVDGSKTTLQSGEILRMNLKQILRGVPNSSLILLRSTAAKIGDKICIPITKDVFNPPVRQEDASTNDETLREMSSIYKKLAFTDKSTSNSKESPVRNNLYAVKRHATNTNAKECMTKKAFLENRFENKKLVQIRKRAHESGNSDETSVNRESNDGMPVTNSGKNRTWCTSKTSEIARILSEYNRSTSRKSAVQNQICDSKSTKANLTSLSAKSVPKSFWRNDATEEDENFSNTSMAVDSSHDKWKRIHLTLETTKNSQFADSNQNTRSSSSTQSEYRQVSSKNRQLNPTTLNCANEELVQSQDLNECEIVMADVKPKEEKTECKDVTEAGALQELLENTAILYCAASGVHQNDLSNYIDSLDNKHSIQWLEN